jgi:hypothetical protein
MPVFSGREKEATESLEAILSIETDLPALFFPIVSPDSRGCYHVTQTGFVRGGTGT